MILALDTTQPTASVGLYRADGSTVFETDYDAMNQHGESLLPELDARLKAAGIMLTELTGVAVCLGPGSFNGVRVGLATAAALRLALGVPVFGASSFARERVAGSSGSATLVSLDAGRGEVYAELVDAAGNLVRDACVCTPEVLDAWLESGTNVERLPKQKGSEPHEPRARMLYAATRGLSPLVELEAVYVRPPDITLPKLRPPMSPA